MEIDEQLLLSLTLHDLSELGFEPTQMSFMPNHTFSVYFSNGSNNHDAVLRGELPQNIEFHINAEKGHISQYDVSQLALTNLQWGIVGHSFKLHDDLHRFRIVKYSSELAPKPEDMMEMTLVGFANWAIEHVDWGSKNCYKFEKPIWEQEGWEQEG